ncbi:hypothetical protein F4778DRAFT_421960 [Xylariomycetidae sp. FL2044]|nr:hypothetical protein F4778DRAFT_421960 [Xylariomycetidae sp. FL2044]
MAATAGVPSHEPPLPSSDSKLANLWKKLRGKEQNSSSSTTFAHDPDPEPGLSRESSPSSGLIRRVSRKVVPGLPRAKTFKRQQSEVREKLEAIQPTPAERRAVSADRRLRPQRTISHTSQPLPRASAPDFFDDTQSSIGPPTVSHIASAPQTPVDEKHFLSLEDVSNASLDLRPEDGPLERLSAYPEALSTADVQSQTSSQYDDMIRIELERKWILNLSMHFRDKSKREKFFVTYRETEFLWRRVTISLDYRNAPDNSLEKDLTTQKFQREKSAKIYEAIRESLQDIQFYDTVTNLKLQTTEGRLHVHVVEDVNEIIPFPTVRMVQHLRCRRIRERDVMFDSHMSGFVYKVRVGGQALIKKEIPGPDTVDEFLYEVNALDALRFSGNIIEFYGVVVDDDDQIVKGLLISYAERGALIDVIYDSQEGGELLPWPKREKWARQIVQGLADVHESGFVQGDFTLSNIVIDDYDNAKIIDINRRGCPVGWEPPEATPLIDSNQRISMYIGVKSDLYQLGMVLWALATLEDEPEAHRRPLQLDPEIDVPRWYRGIVECCLHENPRFRLQATSLLSYFPGPLYDDESERPDLPSISVDDGYSRQEYLVDSHGVRPQIRTVEPRNDWSYATGGQAYAAVSPGLSDEPYYYPPRGRSPPSPMPSDTDRRTTPYTPHTVIWSNDAFAAPGAVTGHAGIDDQRAGTPKERTQAAAEIAKKVQMDLKAFEADLEEISADDRERTQVSGGDSQTEATSPAVGVAGDESGPAANRPEELSGSEGGKEKDSEHPGAPSSSTIANEKEKSTALSPELGHVSSAPPKNNEEEDDGTNRDFPVSTEASIEDSIDLDTNYVYEATGDDKDAPTQSIKGAVALEFELPPPLSQPIDQRPGNSPPLPPELRGVGGGGGGVYEAAEQYRQSIGEDEDLGIGGAQSGVTSASAAPHQQQKDVTSTA